MWDGQLPIEDFWVIPKGSLRQDDAYKFIGFAAAPRAKAELTRYIPYSPGTTDAIAFVDPAVPPHLPTAPAHKVNAMVPNYAFWAEKGDEPGQRFTAWLAK